MVKERRLATLPINLTSMSDPDHLYDQAIAEDRIDNPVVADTDPIVPVTASEFAAPMGRRVCGQQTD
jgi:hypothetical protein